MNKRLDFGSAFSRVFDLYGKHVGPLLIWAAVVQILLSLLVAGLVGAIASGGGVGAALFGGAIVAGFGIVASAVLTGAYIIGLSEAGTEGTFPAFGEVWPRVSPRLGALIVTSLIAGLGIALGFVLLVVPGFILMTWWAVIAPIVMLEDTSGTSALGRSRALVRDEGWTVFGLIIVVAILSGIASRIIGGIVGSILPGDFLGNFGSSFVSGTLTAPISALLAIVVYEALTSSDTTDSQTMPATQAPQTPEPPSGPFV